MNDTLIKSNLEIVLNNLCEELDVPSSKYEDAKKRYEAVGKWLNDDNSNLRPFKPEIYPQGSFELGTVVRPLGDEEYDIDVVCLLKLSKNMIDQPQLKEMVGARLKAHKTYAQMLAPKEGGRRCWTLKYDDDSMFHLDILPAIPDDYGWLTSQGIPAKYAMHAICITDKKTWAIGHFWPQSNPKGYTEWFRGRMSGILLKERASAEPITDYEYRTPLQRAIQLLKRHRDIRYNGHENKPISIIITTLAAHTYNNESNLVDALLNIVSGMRRVIENRRGVWWVPNPVNPQENFADKWAETPNKAILFFEWLDAVERELKELLTERGFQKVGQYLAESYGQRDASSAMRKCGIKLNTPTVGSVLTTINSSLPSRFNVPHREYPAWPVNLQYKVKISARASRENFRTFVLESNYRALKKHFSLRFEASTNVPAPYDVYWQVVNTGSEASNVNGLRGRIFSGVLVQTESTLYRGMHWIECFIVKNGRCVARSGEFVVNIE